MIYYAFVRTKHNRIDSHPEKRLYFYTAVVYTVRLASYGLRTCTRVLQASVKFSKYSSFENSKSRLCLSVVYECCYNVMCATRGF